MLQTKQISLEPDDLQKRRWPAVANFRSAPGGFDELLSQPSAVQQEYLRKLRTNPEQHGKFLQESLSLIYGYVFGYEDSPIYLIANDQLEEQIVRFKINLEREMLEHWLKPNPAPDGLDQIRGGEYLDALNRENSGIYHPFFDYVRDEMSRDSMIEFLKLEAIRNEVVDDEVALIVVGLQGLMKRTMASNLWDECGNGNLSQFHTYWLRRLLSRINALDSLPTYRDEHGPWFAKATSNSFNMLATRPGYKYRAYGSFLITESWVNPHFERIVLGLARTGLDHRDVAVYFASHIRIDPGHTKEMLQAFVQQEPRLTTSEVSEVILGAHTAVQAGTRLYDLALRYFRARDVTSSKAS